MRPGRWQAKRLSYQAIKKTRQMGAASPRECGSLLRTSPPVIRDAMKAGKPKLEAGSMI